MQLTEEVLQKLISQIIIWLRLKKTGNYQIHEFDWLNWILTVIQIFPSRPASRPVMFLREKSCKLNCKIIDCFQKADEKTKQNKPVTSNEFNCSCFRHIINILLTELSRSVWENLDLGRVHRPHCVRSVLTTSVKILHTDLLLS